MPAGTYRVLDGRGNPVGSEEFRCGPGPAGWRYFSTIQTSVPEPHTETVDFTVDRDRRPVRLRVDTGAHELILLAEGGRLAGTLDGGDIEPPLDPAVEVDYLSPCFNAVTAARLDRTTEIEVAYFRPVTCEPVRVRQRYLLERDEVVSTPVGRFEAKRWRYTALDSGWSRPLWVAGDLVVAYEDLFELVDYEPGASGPAALP